MPKSVKNEPFASRQTDITIPIDTKRVQNEAVKEKKPQCYMWVRKAPKKKQQNQTKYKISVPIFHRSFKMESKKYIDPIRAQLNTTSSKQCTYFAQDVGSKKQVFVKGPFASKEKAQIGLNVSALKRLLAPTLPSARMKLVELIPDAMQDCQLGYRLKCNRKEPHWFQETSGVLPNEKRPLPGKPKKSERAWKEPVTVVDWEKLENFTHVADAKEYPESIFSLDKAAGIQFATHIFLSWICGAGADLSYSNFIYAKDKHQVMQVDNDIWLNHWWCIADTCVASKQTKAYEHLRAFVSLNQAHFQQLFDSFVAILDEPYLTMHLIPDYERMILLRKAMVLAEDWQSVSEGWCKMEQVDEEPRKKVKLEEKAVVDLTDEPMVPVEPIASDKPMIDKAPGKVTPCGIFVGKSMHGYRHTMDAWGFSKSVRKSDFQKAIRRGNFRQAWVSFFSMYNLESIYPLQTTAKSLRTDMLNRLVVCAMEDIGIANPRLVLGVTIFTDDFIKVREGIPKIGDSHVVRGAIATYIFNMCLSKKTRVQSHIAHAYAEKNKSMAIAKDDITWSEHPNSLDDANMIRILEEDQALAWKMFGKEIHGVFHKVWKRTTDQSRKAIIRYVFALLHFSRKKLVQNTHGGPDSIKLTLIPIDMGFEAYTKNMKKLDPLECAYDMHTSGGKTQEAKKEFRTEGAKVSNEDESLILPSYKSIYEASLL